MRDEVDYGDATHLEIYFEPGACSKCCQRFMGLRHSLVYRNIHQVRSCGSNP